MRAIGKLCPPGQNLTTPQISLSQQKKIIELPLCPSAAFALVGLELALAKAPQGFAFPPGPLKDDLLFVAQFLQPGKFLLYGRLLLQQRDFALQGEANFSGGGAGSQF